MTRIRSGMTVYVIKKAERCTIHQGSLFAGRKVVYVEKAGFRRSFQGHDSSGYLRSGEPLAPAIMQPIASRSLLPLSLTTSAGKFSKRIAFAKSTKFSEILAITRRSAKKSPLQSFSSLSAYVHSCQRQLPHFFRHDKS